MTAPPTPGDNRWTDEPLSDHSADELGRSPFIETVASRIDRATVADASTVFGLVGEWGSGKSSVIARVKLSLAEDWVVADFTPWSSGDAAAMSIEFVSTLATALDVEPAGEGRAKFARYAGFAAPLLGVVPLAGAVVADTASKVLSEIASRPPWHQQFEELSRLVKDHGKRVLIVIDDVDRLGADELTNLLRIVRLLGRFQGVHYLMAYDQSTVEGLLAASGVAGRATSFMEKIVQYPFEVPPIPRANAMRLVQALMADLVQVTGTRLDEVGLLRQSELIEVLASMITTPRTYGRYRSQLLAFADHVRQAELDLFDYAAVTWLRLEAHEVWRLLPKWRSELNTGSRTTGLLQRDKISTEEWKQRLRDVAGDADPLDLLRVLDLMFPGVSSNSISNFYAHPRSVSEDTFIGRYLLLALPEDDVSDALIAEALNDINSLRESSSTNSLGQLIDGPEPLASLAVSRAMDQRRPVTTASRPLIDFLIERVQAPRSGGEPAVGPSSLLRPWLARELAMGIEEAVITPSETLAKIGHAESFSYVSQFSSVLGGDNTRARRTLQGFADYWAAAIKERPQELIEDGSLLTGAVALVNYAGGSDRIAEALDPLASDSEAYIRLATAFVRFRRWVGSNSVTYEMTFEATEFRTVVSSETRGRYADGLAAQKQHIPYVTDDLDEPEVEDVQLREFVIDSLRALDGGN
ncbi:KAP family NTPase [Microbacterium fluvii]|uniref:KAP family NTPase n=1 Tax=Microbacterium fluvii TaxID=415215 RepID=A0ABW2HFM5_9MICO|nr:KAP family NTPase [Microbacterium fluvii]MCU4673748.1 KAP family NTPase [Microbacterium fluvii]